MYKPTLNDERKPKKIRVTIKNPTEADMLKNKFCDKKKVGKEHIIHIRNERPIMNKDQFEYLITQIRENEKI